MPLTIDCFTTVISLSRRNVNSTDISVGECSTALKPISSIILKCSEGIKLKINIYLSVTHKNTHTRRCYIYIYQSHIKTHTQEAATCGERKTKVAQMMDGNKQATKLQIEKLHQTNTLSHHNSINRGYHFR